MTKRLFAAVMLLVATSVAVVAANIKGKVVDRQTGEALIGATVMVGDNGCATDVNGEFELKGLKRGNLSIIIKYVGYKTLTLKASATDSPNAEPLTIEMESDQQVLGEVIRRVPGVSLIEDKFVMVRGLSQRYNNVWINGGAVPSSEADSRAFSFETHNIFISHWYTVYTFEFENEIVPQMRQGSKLVGYIQRRWFSKVN